MGGSLHFTQGLANCGPCAKSGPPPIFVNTLPLDQSAVPEAKVDQATCVCRVKTVQTTAHTQPAQGAQALSAFAPLGLCTSAPARAPPLALGAKVPFLPL